MHFIGYLLEKEAILGNQLSEQAVLEHLEELKKKNILSVQLAEIKAGHNPYKHGAQIARYVEELGKQLGLCKEEIALIALAAEFHDIGKLMINKRILLKPGPLTRKEYEKIKAHPVYGEALVKPLCSLAVLIRHHHERWDGKGYPDGLKGRGIPLGSRIIAVIDTFNAMTHPRPYCSAKSEKEALQELERCAGTQFDPEIVRLFLKIRGKAVLK